MIACIEVGLVITTDMNEYKADQIPSPEALLTYYERYEFYKICINTLTAGAENIQVFIFY